MEKLVEDYFNFLNNHPSNITSRFIVPDPTFLIILEKKGKGGCFALRVLVMGFFIRDVFL